jgi:hypothetical protein
VAATVPDGNTRRAAPTLSDADEMSGVARVDARYNQLGFVSPKLCRPRAKFRLNETCSPDVRKPSKIGRQTLLFPIAVTGWLGPAGPANFLSWLCGMALGLGAPCRGLRQRPFGGGRQLFVRRLGLIGRSHARLNARS